MKKLKFSIGRVVLPVVMLCSVSLAVALPAQTDFSVESGDASYSASGSEATLTFNQNNSVVNFSGQGFDIAEGATVNVVPGAGGNSSWVGLARDLSGGISNLEGTLALGMNFFLLNQNGVILGNNFTLDLNALTAATQPVPAFMATTFSIDPSDFSSGNYVFSQSGSNGSINRSIEVNGLTVIGENGQVLLVSDDININGNVSLPSGVFSAVAGGEVLVTFSNNNLIQFDITEALATEPGQQVITIGSNAAVESGHINLEAWVNDPLAFAVNNNGVLSAKGLDVDEAGRIRLVGTGGIVTNLGETDTTDVVNGDGHTLMSARAVYLVGQTRNGDNGTRIEIGQAGSAENNAETIGEFTIEDATILDMSTMEVEGFGGRNIIYGLANYQVTGENSGTAGYQGIGSGDYSNIGAIHFDNISWLNANSEVENQLEITETGILRDNFMGSVDGRLIGGHNEDVFIISGTAEVIEGRDGVDIFRMNGGQVNQLLDGGDEADQLLNVIDPVFDSENAFSGSSQTIASWINIEEVSAFIPPTPLPVVSDTSASIIAPQLSFLNLSQNANSALGLIGSDAEPKLPCGYGTTIPTADEKLAAEEDCLDEFATPEYQALLSSIIHFENDSSAITGASISRLNRVSKFVVESERFEKVKISGHTDDNASDGYNMVLSEKRANSTARYMQTRGVDSELIEVHYFGERLPMVPNTSEEHRALNRRAVVELER